MKKLYIILFSLLLLAGACNNDDDTTPANPTPDPEKISFIVNGVTDVFLPETGTAFMGVIIELRNTIQEQVLISVTGLPATVTASISPSNGTPSFTSTLTFNSYKATPGTYPAKINFTSISGVTRTYDFTIRISQPASVMNRLPGTYRINSNPCDTVTRTTVNRNPFGGNSIRFQHLLKRTDFNATVDTVAQTITIPSQPFFGTQSTYEATGTYSNNTIQLNGTIRFPGGGSGTTCNLTLTK